MFKNKFQELLATIGMALGAVILLALFVLLMVNIFPVEASAANVVEVQEVQPIVFDTTAIDTWCRGEDLGTVRMVEGYPAKHSAGGYWTLVDGYGEQWTVSGIGLHHDDFLLLWIADNHTTEDVTDDVIIKVWAEAH